MAFQYISCYSLSEMGDRISKDIRVSIHLMLLFIECRRTMGQRLEPFQYISCYSLSGRAVKNKCRRMAFQYISCYSLSRTTVTAVVGGFVSIHLMLLFILEPDYIQQQSCVSIHLMLLFILSTVGVYAMQQCFNTSHVTLYQERNVPG